MSGSAPPWIQRTDQEKKEWSDLVKRKKGSTVTWGLSGWQDVNKNYETDKVEIALEINDEGGIGCQSCNNKNENGWFGIGETKRGEYQVHRHVCSHHKPRYFFKGGNCPVKNSMKSGNITNFFQKKSEGTSFFGLFQ